MHLKIRKNNNNEIILKVIKVIITLSTFDDRESTIPVIAMRSVYLRTQFEIQIDSRLDRGDL